MKIKLKGNSDIQRNLFSTVFIILLNLYIKYLIRRKQYKKNKNLYRFE